MREAGTNSKGLGRQGRLKFTGVVPASGASRRMGQAKALLAYDGSTFLERVVTALSAGGCERVVVVVAPDSESVRTSAESTGADVMVNPDPGDGPITSLRLALEHLEPEADGIAWLPLDFPLVTREHVGRLLHEADRTDAVLTLPVCNTKRGHPALFRSSLFSELADLSLEGGARTVVHRHLGEACLVPFRDPAVVTDVDTPEAYRALPMP